MASFEPQDVFDPQEPPPRPTTPPVRRGFLLLLALLSLAAILVYGFPFVAERTGYAWEAGRARAATEALYKLEKNGLDKEGVFQRSLLFRLATSAVSPAVVHIEAGHLRREGNGPGVQVGLANWLDPAFEKTTAGSGFVIDKERGYIVTNAHVVNDEMVKVRLSQGAEVTARLVIEGGTRRPTWRSSRSTTSRFESSRNGAIPTSLHPATPCSRSAARSCSTTR